MPDAVLYVPQAVSRAGTEPRQALKPSFLPVSANLCLKYLYTSAQIFAKTVLKNTALRCLGILTAINLDKSRQTNAAILTRIASEFNADLTNFAPLKLNAVQPPFG